MGPPNLIEVARTLGVLRGELFYGISASRSLNMPTPPDDYSTEQTRAWNAGFLSSDLSVSSLARASPRSSMNKSEDYKRDMPILQAAVKAWMHLKLSTVLNADDIEQFLPYVGLFDIKTGAQDHKNIIISFFVRVFASKGIPMSSAQIAAFLGDLIPDEKTVESQTESSVLGPQKAKKIVEKKVSDVLQMSATGQRYGFKEEILAAYRRANNLPPPTSGSKPTKKRTSAGGEIEEPAAKRILRVESSEEAIFRTTNQSGITWRDTDEKQLFSNEAYRHTLFLACGFPVDATDPVISFRQLAFVDMIISAHLTSTKGDHNLKGAILDAENRLQSTFVKAGWTKAAPTPSPFKGFSLIGYKLT